MHDDLYNDIDLSESLSEKYLGLSYKKLALFTLLILSAGTYIGYLLFFGNHSLEVLLGLDEYESYLKDEVYRLKIENSSMQKEYFELQGLRSEN